MSPSRGTSLLLAALGVSFPLFAVEYGRVGLGAVTLAAPVALTGLLIAGNLVRRSVDGSILHDRVGATTGWVAALALAFWLWHVLSALRAENLGWALRDLLKLSTGLLCLWGVSTLVPPDRRALERFWTLLVWSSAILLVLLIYRYALVFRVPYLGTVWHEPSRAARNQMTWYLVFVLPVAYAYVRAGAGPRLVRAVPFLVLVCGLVYAASRGAIASVLVGWLWMSFAGRDVHGLGRFASAGTLALRAALVGVVALQLLGAIVGSERLEIRQRVLALANPDAVPESHSVDYRVAMANAAWDAFAEHPLHGIGLTNTGTFEGLVTHNDYLGLLADTGAIGLLLFLALLVAMFGWIRILPPRGSPDEDWWVTWAGRGSLAAVVVSLLFINAYPNAILWTFFAMARLGRRAAELAR